MMLAEKSDVEMLGRSRPVFQGTSLTNLASLSHTASCLGIRSTCARGVLSPRRLCLEPNSTWEPVEDPWTDRPVNQAAAPKNQQ